MSISTLVQFVRDQEFQIYNEHLILYLMLRSSVSAFISGTLEAAYFMETGKTAAFVDIQSFGLGDQTQLFVQRLTVLGWTKAIEFEGYHGIELAGNNGKDDWYAYSQAETTSSKIRDMVKSHIPEAPKLKPRKPFVVKSLPSTADPKKVVISLIKSMSNRYLEKYGDLYPGCSTAGITGKVKQQGHTLYLTFNGDQKEISKYFDYCFDNWEIIIQQLNLKLADTFSFGVAANPGFIKAIMELRENGPTVSPGDRAGSDNPKEDISDWD